MGASFSRFGATGNRGAFFYRQTAGDQESGDEGVFLASRFGNLAKVDQKTPIFKGE